MAESKEELKRLLMNVKEENEKSGLKVSIQKAKILASSVLTSRQIEVLPWGEVKAATSFILGAPKSPQTVTAAMKERCLLLEREPVTKPGSVLKTRSVTLPTKVYIVKVRVFP